MAAYNKVKRVSDLESLSKVISDAHVLLAVDKKNWKANLGDLDQKKILRIDQTISKEDGKINSINITMKTGEIIRLQVKNGSQGDKGKTGSIGERGDKGDSAIINSDRSANYLMIVNDCETDDNSRVLSASQGVLMNESIDKLSETFMTDNKYTLLFREPIFMDAEFISTQDEEDVLLFNADPADHKLYVKYWTYESDGSVDYFVYNDFGKTYDSVNADLWDDIYLGNTTGYFIATTTQLTDGNELFVLNRSNNEYEKITVDETGNKTFIYYLTDADCTVNVKYDKQTKLYDYSLVAEEMKLNVYQQVSSTEYVRITNKEQLDLSGMTLYYEKVGDEYVYISDISKFIEKKAERYYKKESDNWVEVESLSEIKTDNFEEYIFVEYNSNNNNNVFTHYKPVKTIFETYYEIGTSTLTNYSISFYIYDDIREYFTRKLVDKGNGVFEYEYNKINIPYWVDTEFITDTEDQTVLLLYNGEEKSEIETVDPIYINSIEFEEGEVDIAKNSIMDLSVNISPSNVNITDLILEYDETLFEIFEDGRIMAINADNVTTETTLTLKSAANPNIQDSIKLNIVTDVKEIVLNRTSLELYPGNTFQMEYTTVPEVVSNNAVKWSVSDEKMIKVSETGLVELVKDENGEYTTGSCKLICESLDGFGAKSEIDVLVAIPVEKLIFGKYEFDENTQKEVFKPNNADTNICFIGMRNTLDVVVEPSNATKQEINYTSSDENIIKVNANTGEYEPLAKGTAIISATTTDGTNITISKQMIINVGVTEIKISGVDDKLDIGLTNEFEIELLPENADNKEITFIISDKSIVEYVEPQLVAGTTNKYKGSITAKKAGITSINVVANDGTETGISKDITVTIPIDNITFEQQYMNVFVGDIISLQPIIGPNDATNIENQLIWTSSNSAVATVDAYGRIQAISSGMTVISAMSNDINAVMASCVITVNIKCEEIKLNNGELSKTVLLNNVEFIHSEVIPGNTSNQLLLWSSSDESIVSIQENGVITANSIGTAIINVMATDGSGVTSSIEIQVIDKESTTEEPSDETNENQNI